MSNSSVPAMKNEKTNGGEHVSVVWENVDCVLNQDKLKSLSEAWELDQQTKLNDQNEKLLQHQHHSAGSLSDAGTMSSRSSSKLGSSIRRTSTPGLDDFNWMRKLELRTDIPTITEIRDWSFDPLAFEDVVLVEVFIIMLECYNLLQELHLDRGILVGYATAVMKKHNQDCYYQRTNIDQDGKFNEAEQHTNEHVVLCEYHNWYHAVSCAHAVFLFLTLGGGDQFLQSKDIFSLMIAGLIHDLDHPGTNNDFEVKRETELARRYENDAVLERHSISEGLRLCKENSDFDWIKSIQNIDDRKYIEQCITNAILATDPARHGQVLREAIAFIERGFNVYNGLGPNFFNIEDKEHRFFIGRLFLHAADIINPLHSSFEVARDWAVRVTTGEVIQDIYAHLFPYYLLLSISLSAISNRVFKTSAERKGVAASCH